MLMAEYIFEVTTDMDGVDCYIKRGEIVRCKDCRFHYHDEENDMWWCGFWNDATSTEADWYCHWGDKG